MSKLSEGDQAPAFEAPDQGGKIHRLTDYKGRWIVLYFYPADFTSGCTKEACGFRDAYAVLRGKADVVGVSADSQESHARFSQKNGLPFALLSDPEKKIIGAYGAKGGILTRRFTYIISPKGRIAKIYKSVDPKIHAIQIIRELEVLSSKEPQTERDT
jgi:thioredoxin-dependent peroxiredoxin